ncbi:hypothetical protein [Streptococcus merionis]|uniref:Membrane protein n=1 Tax=Streptococcus merionis TaxID=400065 RepID=A0A239SZ30_9STRE|nr:hypothetical protein [Streptococcus merionis]SNU90775.1 membrane protein [Streptococcus merionis]
MEKQLRLITTVNGIFVLAKASTYFWWGLIKRGFVYGWYGALATCLAFYASSQPYDVSLKEVDYHSETRKLSELFISSMMTFSFLLALVSWFYLLHSYSYQLLLGFLVGSLFWLVMLIWLPFFQKVASSSFKESLEASVRLLVCRLNDVAVLLTLLVFLLFIALTQHLLVWFFLPGIHCFVFTKLDQLRKGERDDNRS